VKGLIPRLISLIALVVGLIVALASCVGPTFVVQQFRGPQRPAAEIAILRVNGPDSVRLALLDDEDVATPLVEDGRLHIEMLPTRHTVVVTSTKSSERSPLLTFVAQAGNVYRVAWASDGRARVFEVQRSSDAIVRDVTIDAPPASPEPPAPARDVPAPPSADPDARRGAPTRIYGST
jgi:hypothetical protein